ncbi:MAG: helix-turn-helix domain-containing protein [Rhizobiales bacterium]|nr:helix-turn-helix domain-containing protein [Hyphomicrobiales bacterium]
MLTNSSITNTTSTNPFTRRAPRLSHAGVLIDDRSFGTRRGRDDDAIGLDDDHLSLPSNTIQITPRDLVKRRTVASRGMTVDIIQATRRERFEYRYRGSFHMLIAYEEGIRQEGVTVVEGLSRSNLRDLRKKLTFVPAGHEYHECHDLRTLSRMTFFYFDPDKVPVLSETGAIDLAPRLYFENAAIWDTALKLTNVIESPNADNQLYLEALGTVLAHELARLEPGTTHTQVLVRGGLAAWQQRIVTSYIEEHLSEQISLATLAQLVRLSPFHFCRAFKQSFGIPPHRYHTSRRIERAKTLLAKAEPSVTDIGLTVGFSQTSSFTAAFRRATGFTPTGYHRSLG